MSTTIPDATYERRIVTVLFADLVGFTALSERLEPEDVASIQDRYFAAVRDAVAHYRGVLEKFVGDAAMAAFGVPTGHDDDAERATRCGLAIVAAVERLDAELGLDAGMVTVRVGVATGEVVHAESGPDAGRLTGDTVNTAARLQTAASAGQVLLSEFTALAVAEVIDLGPPAEIEVKGKAQPVRTRVALGGLASRSREAAMGALRAPTLGRDTELDSLAAALARTTAQGTSERWLIVAPPGTGKTRLLDELAARSAAEVVVRRTRFRADDPRPFGAISDLVSGLVGDDLEVRLVTGGLATGRAAVVAEALTRLAAGPAAEDGASPDRETRFAAWLDGFTTLTAGRGELWLVEDAHWAGRDALAFLDAADDRPGRGGRLVIVTARPSLLETDPAWCASDPTDRRHRIDLPGLTGGPAVALIHALVGDALQGDLVAHIAEASDGNCLFIEELLRTWVSVGVLRPDGDGWTMDTSAERVAIPLTVHAVYGVQLDDLPPSARAVARRAAVAGRRFPVDALAALGIADRAGAIDSLARRALITGPAELGVVGAGYAYRHALLRDAAYASLARAERARLHVALARWLEAAAGDRVDEVAGSIGAQYDAALASAPTLAADVAPGLDRRMAAAHAATWLERAAGRAMREAADDTAAALIERSLDLTPVESTLDSGRRWLELGRISRRAGRTDRAADAYEQAMARARTARGSGLDRADMAVARSILADAGAALAKLYFEQIRFVDAWRLADAVLDEIGPTDDVESARLMLARASGRGGETNEAGPWIDDASTALAIAREAGDRPLELAALSELAWARDEAGDVTVDDFRAIDALARELGDWDAAAGAMISESGFLLDERPADVPTALQPARDIAETWLLTERLGWVLQRTCEAGLATGDWDRGIGAGMDAVDLGESGGFHRVVVRTITSLLVMGGWRGDRDIVARCQAWYQEAEGRGLPDSPYGRVLFANASAWFGRFGLIPPSAPDPDRLREGLSVEPSGPAWLGCVATILGSWRADGLLAPCREILDSSGQALGRARAPSSLAVGAMAVELAALEAASGKSATEVEAIVRGGLPVLRRVGAAWWILRGLRLLERLDRASRAERSEARDLEGSLGLPIDGPGVD